MVITIHFWSLNGRSVCSSPALGIPFYCCGVHNNRVRQPLEMKVVFERKVGINGEVSDNTVAIRTVSMMTVACSNFVKS